MTIAKPIPRLPGLPVFGNLWEFKKDRLALYRRICERYGDIGVYTLLSKPFALLSHAEMNRQVLIEHHTDFERSPVMLMMKPILGEGLLTTDNASNSRQRQWINPVFQSERFPGYARLIVEHTQALCSRWSDGRSVDLSSAMQQLTLGIIGKAMFSADVFQDVPEFVQALTDLLHATDQRLKFLLPLPSACPLPANLKLKASLHPLNAIINRLIEERRIALSSGSESSYRSDLLSLLLASIDETTGQPLSNRQIRDQIITFLFAGYETTANTLSWTFYLLARNPAVYERLQSEVASVLQGNEPDYEDLKRLPYTLQVLKETLRLYPVAYAFGRTALKSLQIGDYRIPKGMVVLTCPYVMHRRPDYFEHPEQFDPDRFLPEREARIPRFAYLPFGAGPRACIGRQFAMMEAQLILASLAQKVRFSLLNEAAIFPEPVITLRPSVAIQMRITPLPVHREAISV